MRHNILLSRFSLRERSGQEWGMGTEEEVKGDKNRFGALLVLTK
jgi:hypothetical protein